MNNNDTTTTQIIPATEVLALVGADTATELAEALAGAWTQTTCVGGYRSLAYDAMIEAGDVIEINLDEVDLVSLLACITTAEEATLTATDLDRLHDAYQRVGTPVDRDHHAITMVLAAIARVGYDERWGEEREVTPDEAQDAVIAAQSEAYWYGTGTSWAEQADITVDWEYLLTSHPDEVTKAMMEPRLTFDTL